MPATVIMNEKTKISTDNVIPISKLQSNDGQIDGLPANPRLIKDDKFRKLVRSLEEDPEMMNLRPCLVYPHGEGFIIIGGNMRYRAVQELGWTDLPCKIIPPETSVEKLRAYTLKDNASYGEWDYDLLGNEWDAVQLNDCGVDVWQDNTFGVEENNEIEGVQNGSPSVKEPIICPHCGKFIEQ